MKSLTAILLLCLMLFNLVGYRLAIQYLHAKNSWQLATQIDKNEYKEEELISIKTPLSLPYYTNSETYERVDGVISVEGQYFHYVKRRVFNDSLELLCLPNPVKARLDKVEVEISKSILDGSATEKNNKIAIVLKMVLPEYIENNDVLAEIQPVTLETIAFSSYTFFLPQTNLAVLTPPPDFMHNRYSNHFYA